ncbi:alanine--glyoxylate aminotransferase family protein [Candidatus Binatia bacterium]|nr:alanine--glyoxylate aminotransferase family protein [Candidatus Binatia bacterium]
MILLNPGPVNVSPRVTAAMSRGDLCHREPEFQQLLDSVRVKLVRALAPDGDWVAVPLTGSGTLALEAGVTSVVSSGRRMLVVVNGVYGERILEMAQTHGIATVVVRSDWGRPPDLAAIDNVLRADPDVEVVALVHHETTTGLLNPVEAVGRITRAHGRVLFVDAISGLAGDTLRLEEWGVGVCVGVANKCIQGIPGIGFVLAQRREMQRMAEIPPRSVYMHLPRHFAAHEKHTVPFTAAVQVLYALDEALDELLEEGVDARVARYGRAASLLRAGFERLGLRLMLPPELRSNSITTLTLPAGLTYQQLHDRVRKDGFVIYEGQGQLSTQVFRVANMGALSEDDFMRFLASLERAMGGASA